MLTRSLLATVLVGAAFVSSASAQERVRWRMASALALNFPVTGDGAIYIADRLRKASRGRIDIRPYDPDKLVPVSQIFEAVRTGSIDAGWSFSAYWQGQNPAYAFFTSVPFGLGLTHYMSWMYEGGGLQLWNELYEAQGIHVLPCNIIPPEASGWFRNEINSVDQLKGLKIRYPGIAGRVLQKLGASVQLIPTGEVFVALDRGLIDGTELALPSLDYAAGLHKVAKHYYFPGWHQPSTFGELMINKQRWDALDEADRTLIEMSCRDNLVRDIALFESTQSDALRKIAEAGVKIHIWSPELMAEFRRVTAEVMEEMSNENQSFKRVYESIKVFSEKNKDWRDLTSSLR
jgi:TRAP-type mannitol/chloroaromatic compound transport system substrate-binding protein